MEHVTIPRIAAAAGVVALGGAVYHRQSIMNGLATTRQAITNVSAAVNAVSAAQRSASSATSGMKAFFRAMNRPVGAWIALAVPVLQCTDQELLAKHDFEGIIQIKLAGVPEIPTFSYVEFGKINVKKFSYYGTDIPDVNVYDCTPREELTYNQWVSIAAADANGFFIAVDATPASTSVIYCHSSPLDSASEKLALISYAFSEFGINFSKMQLVKLVAAILSVCSGYDIKVSLRDSLSTLLAKVISTVGSRATNEACPRKQGEVFFTRILLVFAECFDELMAHTFLSGLGMALVKYDQVNFIGHIGELSRSEYLTCYPDSNGRMIFDHSKKCNEALATIFAHLTHAALTHLSRFESDVSVAQIEETFYHQTYNQQVKKTLQKLVEVKYITPDAAVDKDVVSYLTKLPAVQTSTLIKRLLDSTILLDDDEEPSLMGPGEFYTYLTGAVKPSTSSSKKKVSWDEFFDAKSLEKDRVSRSLSKASALTQTIANQVGINEPIHLRAVATNVLDFGFSTKTLLSLLKDSGSGPRLKTLLINPSPSKAERKELERYAALSKRSDLSQAVDILPGAVNPSDYKTFGDDVMDNGERGGRGITRTDARLKPGETRTDKISGIITSFMSARASHANERVTARQAAGGGGPTSSIVAGHSGKIAIENPIDQYYDRDDENDGDAKFEDFNGSNSGDFDEEFTNQRRSNIVKMMTAFEHQGAASWATKSAKPPQLLRATVTYSVGSSAVSNTVHCLPMLTSAAGESRKWLAFPLDAFVSKLQGVSATAVEEELRANLANCSYTAHSDLATDKLYSYSSVNLAGKSVVPESVIFELIAYGPRNWVGIVLIPPPVANCKINYTQVKQFPRGNDIPAAHYSFANPYPVMVNLNRHHSYTDVLTHNRFTTEGDCGSIFVHEGAPIALHVGMHHVVSTQKDAVGAFSVAVVFPLHWRCFNPGVTFHHQGLTTSKPAEGMIWQNATSFSNTATPTPSNTSSLATPLLSSLYDSLRSDSVDPQSECVTFVYDSPTSIFQTSEPARWEKAMREYSASVGFPNFAPRNALGMRPFSYPFSDVVVTRNESKPTYSDPFQITPTHIVVPASPIIAMMEESRAVSKIGCDPLQLKDLEQRIHQKWSFARSAYIQKMKDSGLIYQKFNKLCRNDPSARRIIWIAAAAELAKTTGAGFLYETFGVPAPNGPKTKAHFFECLLQDTEKLIRFLDKIESIYCALGSPRANTVFPVTLYVKQEPTKLSKFSEGKGRTIKEPYWPLSIIQLAMTSLIRCDKLPTFPEVVNRITKHDWHQPFFIKEVAFATIDDVFTSNSFSDYKTYKLGHEFGSFVGRDLVTSLRKLVGDSFPPTSVCFSGDVSKWDKSLDLPLIEAMFSVIFDDKNYGRNFARGMNRDALLNMQGYVFAMLSVSWCSGNLATLTGNSIIHDAITSSVCEQIRAQYKVAAYALVQGDDFVIISPNLRQDKIDEVKDLITRNYALSGFSLKLLDISTGSFDFCSMRVDTNGPQVDLVRIITKMAAKRALSLPALRQLMRLSPVPCWTSREKDIISATMGGEFATALDAYLSAPDLTLAKVPGVLSRTFSPSTAAEFLCNSTAAYIYGSSAPEVYEQLLRAGMFHGLKIKGDDNATNEDASPQAASKALTSGKELNADEQEKKIPCTPADSSPGNNSFSHRPDPLAKPSAQASNGDDTSMM